jgi:hypothetical protein
MKKMMLVLLMICATCFAFAANVPLQTLTKSENVAFKDVLNFQKEVEIIEKTQKLSFFEKVTLRIFQKKIEKQLKKELVAKDDRKTNGLALTSMILGIVAMVLSISIIGLVSAILALIFGAIGLSQINKNKEKYKGKGFAIAGLVMGIIGCAIYGLLIAAA